MSYDTRRSFIQAVRAQEADAELERRVQEDHAIDNDAAREGITWARTAPRELTSPFEGEAVYQVVTTSNANNANANATSNANKNAATTIAANKNHRRCRRAADST